MSKYIPADKLIAEIEDRLHCNGAFDEVGDYGWHYDKGMVDAYNHIKEFITSLQQEQPEVDVNLSEEIENFCLEYDARKEAWYNMLPKDQKLIYNPTWQNFATNLAYHFYNRGYNAKKV